MDHREQQLAYRSDGKPGVRAQTTTDREPEILLGIPFNEAIDMLSLGVTAAELGAPSNPGTRTMMS